MPYQEAVQARGQIARPIEATEFLQFAYPFAAYRHGESLFAQCSFFGLRRTRLGYKVQERFLDIVSGALLPAPSEATPIKLSYWHSGDYTFFSSGDYGVWSGPIHPKDEGTKYQNGVRRMNYLSKTRWPI